MSSLINRILSNLSTRIMLIIYASIIAITGFFIVFSYYNELQLQEERQYDKLSGIVNTLTTCMNGDAHEDLMNRYPKGVSAEQIKSDSTYQFMSTQLNKIVELNKLSPMYTLVYLEKTDEFVYGVRSDDFLDFKNPYQQPPKELREKMETGGIIPKYESENGTWLSAFAPIKNKEGKVIALVEADINFDEFTTLVNKRYASEVVIAALVIILMAFILIPYARKLLAEDQKQKELALHQTLELAQKNKDIMASIRYALKIQTAIFPSDETFRKNEREIFVYHAPKDVVAGDFYWIERHENNLFFAVADCTGHGVPGAILSIVCINALNNAVELCASDETGVILDTTRRLIAKQIGTDENQMSDGMDIALCRLNLDTNELSYSGAFNPIYIFEKNPQKMTVLSPDKQPVGNYVRQVPFTSKSHQLQPGDMVYLFTDGYADQFGGEFGKKYNYKSFQKLLESLSNLSLNEQKKELRKAFIAWMKDHEQLDDVCVMGVKI